MLQVSYKYNLVPKYQSCEDIRNELNGIKHLCVKHEHLCRSFAKWKSYIEQNDCQLEILNKTAASLRSRHKMLRDALAMRPKDPSILTRLERDICAVEAQVNVFIRELTEINDDRTKLDMKHAMEFIHLRTSMQRSMTNIELAHMDVDKLQNKHRRLWRQFLHSNSSDNGTKAREEGDERLNQ
ncbi:hypothetical protein Ddc_17372 [Ditylenchus destructor]|nr:hypothetical protein Ddc_17372 [Ditylenchus destructor]